MEYTGEDPFGDDIWFCEGCHAEEEAEFQRSLSDDFGDLEDGDECPHCGSRHTDRVDTISSEPEIWFCGCDDCGETFEVVISQDLKSDER